MDLIDKPSPLRAQFYKHADGQRDLIEIRVVGDPNSVIYKVKPEHVEQFPREWAAYQARQEKEPEPETQGTSLLDVPGIDRVAAAKLKMFEVRTAEELAGLDEAQAKALGLGGLTFWKSAKLLLRAQQAEKLQALMNKPDAPELEPAPQVEPVKRKPGRPPKSEEAA